MAKLTETAPLAMSAHLSKFERAIPNGTEWTVVPSEWVMLQLREGIAYALDRRGNREVALGSLLVCPPKSKVTLTASVLERALFRGTALRLESLAGILTALERRCLENEVAQQSAPFLEWPADHELARRMGQLLTPEANMSLSNRLGFAQLFAELVTPQLEQALSKGVAEEKSQQDAKARLHWVMKQMPEAEMARLTLRELAALLHCCERHTSRLFREAWGSSFPAYVSELRLKKACELLARGNLKIIDVALESGHGSLAHFNYVFKKRYRMTPTEWRTRGLAAPRGASRAKLEMVAGAEMGGRRIHLIVSEPTQVHNM